MPNRTLRLDAHTDALVRIAAAERGESVHAWILAAIRGHLLRQAHGPRGVALAATLDAATAPAPPQR